MYYRSRDVHIQCVLLILLFLMCMCMKECVVSRVYVTVCVFKNSDLVLDYCYYDVHPLPPLQYRGLAPMYYRGSAAAIVVYDITSEVRPANATALIVI